MLLLRSACRPLRSFWVLWSGGIFTFATVCSHPPKYLLMLHLIVNTNRQPRGALACTPDCHFPVSIIPPLCPSCHRRGRPRRRCHCTGRELSSDAYCCRRSRMAGFRPATAARSAVSPASSPVTVTVISYSSGSFVEQNSLITTSPFTCSPPIDDLRSASLVTATGCAAEQVYGQVTSIWLGEFFCSATHLCVSLQPPAHPGERDSQVKNCKHFVPFAQRLIRLHAHRQRHMLR